MSTFPAMTNFTEIHTTVVNRNVHIHSCCLNHSVHFERRKHNTSYYERVRKRKFGFATDIKANEVVHTISLTYHVSSMQNQIIVEPTFISHIGTQ